MTDFPPWEPNRWRDVAENPLILPLNERQIQGVVGDPQVLLPGEFDDRWHLFAWNNQSIPAFAHFASSDGLRWTFVDSQPFNCGPFYLSHDGAQWIVYYTHYGEGGSSTISARTSKDLSTWSEPVPLVAPSLDWEREGPRMQVRNPNPYLLPNGRCRLYYSAGTVWMDDMGFEEPKYVGFAESDSWLGPFTKHEQPILGPDPTNRYLNYGAGALKVYAFGRQFLGILNGIYLDEARRSRSALNVYLSKDGIEWDAAPYNPIIEPGDAWKRALVYQLDLRYYGGKLLLYYNARDDWRDGKECIGLSTLDWDGDEPRKPWALSRT